MIKYVIGDATNPIGDGPKMIVHIVNDAGVWGAGFVMAVSKRWPLCREYYIHWIKAEKANNTLGKVLLFATSDEKSAIFIVNLVGQHGTKWINGVPPIRLDAITHGLETVWFYAKAMSASIHMPRIGSGLAGGKWEEIEPIIEETLKGLDVTVYDLPGKVK